MTSLSEIGEFGLIQRFSAHFVTEDQNITGIGDDCAILPLNEKENLLVTTDMLIQDRHFLLDKITPYELGYKALAVNLSDIAAMGGVPMGAFLSIGIPAHVDLEFIDPFFAGLKYLSDQTRTPLLGGDTTKSPDKLVVNIAVLGKAGKQQIRKRSFAKPGDYLCVTDNLGDSGAGLQVLLENLPVDGLTQYFLTKHHMPKPQLEEGEWLSKQDGVRAMMDISDGVESDIHRIMESSQVGARVDIDRLPVSENLQLAGKKYLWNIQELALSSGEDYCLLVTIDPTMFDKVDQAYQKAFNRSLYKIGSITDSPEKLELFQKGVPVESGKHGFDHFKNS